MLTISYDKDELYSLFVSGDELKELAYLLKQQRYILSNLPSNYLEMLGVSQEDRELINKINVIDRVI